MLLDLFCNLNVAFVILAYDKGTCRVLVNPMDNAGTDFTIDAGKAVFAMVHDGID